MICPIRHHGLPPRAVENRPKFTLFTVSHYPAYCTRHLLLKLDART